MANKSEEIIEKPVVSRGRPKKTTKSTTKKTKKATASKKSTRKTTKKTSKKVTKPVIKIENEVNAILENVLEENVVLTDVEITVNNSENIGSKIEEFTDATIVPEVQQEPEVIQEKIKRHIKCPSVKKVSPVLNDSTPIKTVPKKRISSTKRGIILTPNIENVSEIIVTPKNNKRTLKLNLNSVRQENNDTEIKDISESINQNSIFFNSPSIFDKFDINITNTESEEVTDVQNLPEINENINESLTDIQEEQLDVVEEKTEESAEIVENIESTETILATTDEVSIIEESSEEELDTITEELSEMEKQISDEILEDSIEVEDLVSETSLEELIEADIDLELQEEIQENIINISENQPEELKQVADTIVQEPVIEKTTSDNPIGKFFDSSIPSMTSTVNNTFSKIKKSFLKSPIFKKFTFEEASLANNKQIENNFIEPENNLSDIQKALENFTPNAENNITEMDIQAEPVGIVSPVINPIIVDEASPLVTEFNGFEPVAEPAINYTNVITIPSDTAYDDIADEDETDYNPETYNFSNKLVDRLTDSEENEAQEQQKEIDYDNISQEDIDNLKKDDYNDETFSIESYFGIDNNEKISNGKKEIKSKNNEESIQDNIIEENNIETENEDDENEFVDKFLKTNSKTSDYEEIPETLNNIVEENNQDNKFEEILKEKDSEISNLSKLLEKYSETISSLSSRIENLENGTTTKIEKIPEEVLTIDDITLDDIDLNDVKIEDLDINENDIVDNEILDENNSELLESLLSEAFLNKNLNNDIKDELLSELLSSGEFSDEALLSEDKQNTSEEYASVDDFSKIIESLTKAITELEGTPDIKEEYKPATPPSNIDDLPNELISNVTEEKAINILINKDDIFSISILNETYEIVTDFDGVSVLSENIHISTPKNNFYVKVGTKYIEIHKKKDYFILNTNFEDIEFANAINNISFAKKDNKIELNIKEAFKLSSVNNKIELSILSKAIVDIASATNVEEKNDDSSICDNKTLVISEETQKVYLPYTIEDVMKKLRKSDEYQTVQEVVENEYTLPLSTFKMPIVSRFKEAYRFMRVKEKSSVYAAVDLALELMFNSNLNPAVIRAAKDLKELNIYLDCLYENEVEKFDCFKIIYKVLPKIK